MEDKSKRKGKTGETAKVSTAGGRSRTIERRKEREREQRRQRQTYLAIGLAVVAVVVVVMIALSNLPADAPIPETALTRYVGLQVSRSAEGYPRLGNPDAPVQVVEYSSFACPACQSFHENSLQGLIDRVRTGDILLTYVPMFSTGSVANGEGAALAAVCAAEQDGFWPFHDVLFDWQTRFGNQAFTQARMGTAISNLGLDRAAFEACLRTGTPGAVTQAAEAEAAAVPGFTGTPAITVNGVITAADLTTINAAIDQALTLAGTTPEATAEATTEATSEATGEATVESTAAVEATTEATSEPTTASTAAPTSEATTEPTAESTAAP